MNLMLFLCFYYIYKPRLLQL